MASLPYELSQSNTLHAMATRRPHTKSRTGCKECKRRRIKVRNAPGLPPLYSSTLTEALQCDEERPVCFHCARYGAVCSFGGSQDVPQKPNMCTSCGTLKPRHARHVSPARGNDSLEEARASPSNMRVFLPDDVQTSFHSSGFEYGPAAGPPSFPNGTHSPARDLELMHHYCTMTSSTMGLREDVRHVWRVVIPQEGYENPFVMHGILALSAMHKVYLLPDKRQTYLMLCAHHYTCGQDVFRALMSHITDKNWRPMLCFALILVAYTCSLPSARLETIDTEDSISMTLELFFMIRGIKAILDPFMKNISQTDFSPLMTSVWNMDKGSSIRPFAFPPPPC